MKRCSIKKLFFDRLPINFMCSTSLHHLSFSPLRIVCLTLQKWFMHFSSHLISFGTNGFDYTLFKKRFFFRHTTKSNNFLHHMKIIFWLDVKNMLKFWTKNERLPLRIFRLGKDGRQRMHFRFWSWIQS